MSIEFQPVIGLEVHVQLKTKSKVFCGCSTEFGSQPNSQVCPVCLGFPGVLPVLNKLALDYSRKVGLALNCTVQEFTKFDRKHYYYPDLPKNIQISQYDLPIATDGYLEVEVENKSVKILIKRAHLEEDAGKLIHKDNVSLVDYNRTGMPLLEIVTEPVIHSPLEAYEYLTALKSIIQYLGVSDCDMEKGSLRCDANISVRPMGETKLGTKSELKNLNSFKSVKDSLEYEIQRHTDILNSGEKIVQETRLWDDKTGKTVTMRSKEEAKDYRYFPEPDLPPFVITKEEIEKIKKNIPELPKAKAKRFMNEYGLSNYDAKILVVSKNDADFAEDCMKLYENKKAVANWLIGPVAALANEKNISFSQTNIKAVNLVELIKLVDGGQISNLVGKTVLQEMIETGKSAADIVKEKNLVQISDESSLLSEIDVVIKDNLKSVEDFKAGNTNAVMFLVGQVMKRTKGKANPKVVQDLLKRRLANG